MKKKLADVLWEAANVHLWSGDEDGMSFIGKVDDYSCNSVAYALGLERGKYEHPAFPFLYSLGCTSSALAFMRICGITTRDAESQGVRYMWLLLAMHVAEDEGIMVEVAG